MGNLYPSIVCYENSMQTNDQETTTTIIIKWLKHRSMICIESVLHTRQGAETEENATFYNCSWGQWYLYLKYNYPNEIIPNSFISAMTVVDTFANQNEGSGYICR